MSVYDLDDNLSAYFSIIIISQIPISERRVFGKKRGSPALQPGSAGEGEKSLGLSRPRSIRRCYYFCLVKRVTNTTHGIIYRLSDVMHRPGQMA
jgi:hypothetical protein